MRYSLKIIQVYAPTSASDDEEVDAFYEDLSEALSENACFYNIVMGDFNAKIGRTLESEEYVGKYGLGRKNERGHALVNFLEQKKLYAANTFFQKKNQRLWTWRSPGGETTNQIDFILGNKKYIFQDVDVINKRNNKKK